jgi:superfamily II helicase
MNIRTVATYVLQALARAQIEGRLSNLETLRDELQVRKTDIRAAVSQLHREGMVDALHMRLTLAGLAVGHALADQELPPLRKAAEESAPAEPKLAVRAA